MKKPNIIITFAVSAILFYSCGQRNSSHETAPTSRRLELDTATIYYDQQYKVYTLEGCEYIVVDHGDRKWGSHKGTCKNPIHKQ